MNIKLIMYKRGVNHIHSWKSLLLVFLMVITIFFLKANPTITGLAVYKGEYEEQSQVHQWIFSNFTDYFYNLTLLNLSTREVRLIPQITYYNWTTELRTPVVITSALLHTSGNKLNKTLEIQAIDGEHVNLNKNNSNLLDLALANALNNGDMLSLYLLQGNNIHTSVYLCDNGTVCNAPGYGLVEFNGEAGWYNITISNLSSPKTIFALDPPNHIKIDYVKAIAIEFVEHNVTNSTYPSSAGIETTDLNINNLQNFNSFSRQEILNNQHINYSFSLNSGVSWQNISESGRLSSVNTSSGKIRIKAILNSDGASTPILNEMNLTYTVKICAEDWAVHYGECLINNSKLKYYLDENNCGTTNNFPVDNGIYVSCDYCILHNCTGSFEKLFYINGSALVEVNALNRTSTKLYFNSSRGGTPFLVTIIKYNRTAYSTPPQAASLDQYFNIGSNLTIIDAAKLVFYYTDKEMEAKNIQENTLSIYYYNETGKYWEKLDSVVNVTDNSIYAIISHLSWYGLLEKENEVNDNVNSVSSSSGGGGWGRISSSDRNIVAELEEGVAVHLPVATETAESQTSPNSPKIQCDYVLEVSLPEQISFIKQNSYTGKIINKGNCVIDSLAVYSSPELDSVIEFSPAVIIDLQQGNTSSFVVIRRTESEHGLFSWLTGSAVAPLVTKLVTKEVEGNIIMEITDDHELVFTKTIPLQIETIAADEIVNAIKITFPLLLVAAVLLVLIIINRRKRLTIKTE